MSEMPTSRGDEAAKIGNRLRAAAFVITPFGFAETGRQPCEKARR
jgi:hypothetical protein